MSKIIEVTKRQDDDGHWYWIPSEIIAGFDQMLSAIEGKLYMDCPDQFDSFSSAYEDYRTGGSPEIQPDYYHKNNYVVEIIHLPKEWPPIEEIIKAKTIDEKVKDILDEPNIGHPSRNLESEIKKMKEAILVLAKEASFYNR